VRLRCGSLARPCFFGRPAPGRLPPRGLNSSCWLVPTFFRFFRLFRFIATTI
jgi:hypothetical protein